MPGPSWTRWALPIVGVPALGGVLLVALWGYDRWANTVPPFRPPVVRFPSPNGYDRAAVLAAALPAEPGRGLPPWPEGPSEQLRRFVRPVLPKLDAIHDTFALEWRAPLPLDKLGPQQKDDWVWRCGRYFEAASMLAREEGEHGVAMERALDVMELASKATRGAPVLTLVGTLDVHRRGLHLAEQAWPTSPTSVIPDALTRVRRIRSSWPSLTEILEAERVDTLADATRRHQQVQNPRPMDTLRSVIGHAQMIRVPSLMKHSLLLWLTPKRQSLQSQERYLRQVIAESKKAIGQQRSIPLPTDYLAEIWVTRAVFLQENRRLLPDVQTDLARLEVALAVRMHRLERGRHPARLEEISRRWLPVVPRQPDGTPIRYELRGGKPVVYSLGRDGKRRTFGALTAGRRALTPGPSPDNRRGERDERLTA